MSNTGETLINAIVSNNYLMAINNCPGVPAQMSRAVYGKTQDDSGPEPRSKITVTCKRISISRWGSLGRTRNRRLAFHDWPARPPFCGDPWYQHTAPHGRVYTVFMAYENRYSVGGYVQHTPPAPSAVKGYRTVWSVTDLAQMFSDLLTSATAWQTYFGAVGAAQANKITYWKYKVTSLDSAVANVNKYR